MVKNNITQGNITKEVFLFFIPIVISTFFQHLYGIVDAIIIGRYLGDVAFASVGGSSAKAIRMFINFFVGMSAGVTVYTSQYYGKNDFSGVKKIIYNGSCSFLVFSVVLAVLGIVFCDPYLIAMQTPENTMAFSKTYLNTSLVGITFCVFYNLYSGVFRAMGDAKTPLYVLIFCSILNIILDFLLIVFIPMGVFGAALATVSAQGVSAIMLGVILKKRFKNETISKTLDMKMITDIFKLGIPAGLQSIMYSLSNMLVQSAVNSFGQLTVTAWTAYLSVDCIIDMFLTALGSTAITFVGQNKGAGNMERVKESVVKIIGIAYVVLIPLVGIFMLARVPLMSLFTETAEVTTLASTFFFIIMPMYLLGVPNSICSQAVRGLGKSFEPMMMTLVGVVGLRFLWVLFIFPMNPTIHFLGICYPISSCIMSVIFIFYYRKEVKRLC